MVGGTIVLISGKRGAGKDYFASLLQHLTDGQQTVHVVPTAHFAKCEFADRSHYSLDRLLHDRAYKEEHRSALIAWAEYQKATVRPTYWIERAAVEYRRLANQHAKPCVIAVPDFRFQCEYEYLIEHLVPEFHVVTVRLDAPVEVRASRGVAPNPSADAHVSECELDAFTLWDHCVCNDGTTQGDEALLRCANNVLTRALRVNPPTGAK